MFSSGILFFIIDKFHAPSHKSCSPAYHPKFFLEMIGTNTEVCCRRCDCLGCSSVDAIVIVAVVIVFEIVVNLLCVKHITVCKYVRCYILFVIGL